MGYDEFKTIVDVVKGGGGFEDLDVHFLFYFFCKSPLNYVSSVQYALLN